MKQPIILIDAYSQIFRSFFAVKTLTNSLGEPINALHVFSKLLLTIERKFPTDQGALFFDCGRVEFRLKILPEYKANRPPMPVDLRKQMPLLREMASAFGWPLLQADNYEADDLIGAFTIANADKEIRIISADKDLFQLVNQNVKMLSPAKGNSGELVERGLADAVEKFGVVPELIADYLALVGDNSDNISGVAGIGPKGAAEILNTFGPIEKWLNSIDKMNNCRWGVKLKNMENLLKRNLSLTRLKTILPDCFGIKDLNKKTPSWLKIADICQNHGLRSVLKEISKETGLSFDKDESNISNSNVDLSSLELFAGCKQSKTSLSKSTKDEMVQGELF